MKVDMKRRIAWTVSAAALSTAIAAPHAVAQVDEIIVSATKREESLQEVPIAITAVSGDQLDRGGVKDLKDLPTLAPSFNINSSQTESGGTTLRLRGVGTTGNNVGLESAVGVFLDGVYLSRAGVALGDLLDVEQIEILRGPQGTLFGRNTSAGALSVKTKKADLNEFEMWANATYGNFDTWGTQVGANLPLVQDKFAVRVAGAFRNQDEGWVQGLGESESYTRNRYLLKGQFQWQINDSADLRVIADIASTREACCDGVLVRDTVLSTNGGGTGGAFLAAGLPANGGVQFFGDSALDNRRGLNEVPIENNTDQNGISAELNWLFDNDVSLTYIGAFRHYESESVQTDFSNLDFYRVPGVNGYPGYSEIDNTTHELRLQGVNGRLDWLVGAYYSNEEIEGAGVLELGADYTELISAGFWFGGIIAPTVFGALPGGSQAALAAAPLATGGTFGDILAAAAVPPADPSLLFAGGADAEGMFHANLGKQEGSSWSFFTHNTLAITDQLDLTVGLRWVEEEKDGSITETANGGGAYCLNTLANVGSVTSDAGVLAAAGADLTGATTQYISAILPAAVVISCNPFAAPFNAAVPSALPQEFDETFEDDELVYVGSLSYQWTPEINTYASISHGFKSGGFNIDPTAAIGGADPSFSSEIVDSYEVGIKSDWFGGILRANLTGFWMELEDFQVLEFTGVQFTTFNVEKAESKGAELELTWAPIDGLTIGEGLTYAKAEYPDDCDSSTNVNATSLCGFPLTNSSEWVSVTTLNYDTMIPNTDLFAFVSASARYESERRTGTQAVVVGTNTLAVEDIQDGNIKANLRVGVGSADESWTLELWGNNIFDEQTKNVTFNIPFRGTTSFGTGARGVFIDAPRTYGVTVRARF